MPELRTLIDDIYKLFDEKEHHEPNEENLQAFADTMVSIIRTRLGKRPETSSPLRFSSLGRPDRQLWYMAQNTAKEELSPKTYMKFLYGDIIEAFVLFLAKESGHSVTDEQREVEVSGVKGHIDCILDGAVVDVKSASPYGFKKFKDHSLLDNDPFGYIKQISGYSNVLTPEKAPAFLAFDKVSGDLCLMEVSTSITAEHQPGPRIEHLKAVIASPEMPERCYNPIPDGASGNMKLGTECSYCAFKASCYPSLRTFIYSTGPRFLTKVAKVPNVPEVNTQDDTDGEEA